MSETHHQLRHTVERPRGWRHTHQPAHQPARRSSRPAATAGTTGLAWSLKVKRRARPAMASLRSSPRHGQPSGTAACITKRATVLSATPGAGRRSSSGSPHERSSPSAREPLLIPATGWPHRRRAPAPNRDWWPAKPLAELTPGRARHSSLRRASDGNAYVRAGQRCRLAPHSGTARPPGIRSTRSPTRWPPRATYPVSLYCSINYDAGTFGPSCWHLLRGG
jgi:hypothetical protein